jgi:hypothetical protein
MSNFLDKYKSVYNVFLDNWSYQSHYVMFLEKLLYEETVLPVHIKEMIFGYISSLNECIYCKNIHVEIAKELIERIKISSPLEDISMSSIE